VLRLKCLPTCKCRGECRKDVPVALSDNELSQDSDEMSEDSD